MLFKLLAQDLCRIAQPKFELAISVHDWRNHVPDEVKEAWSRLSQEAKEVAYIAANTEADAEEWD